MGIFGNWGIGDERSGLFTGIRSSFSVRGDCSRGSACVFSHRWPRTLSRRKSPIDSTPSSWFHLRTLPGSTAAGASASNSASVPQTDKVSECIPRVRLSGLWRLHVCAFLRLSGLSGQPKRRGSFRCRIFSERDYSEWKEPSPAPLARSRGRRLILPSSEEGRASVGPLGEGFKSGRTALWGMHISVPALPILVQDGLSYEVGGGVDIPSHWRRFMYRGEVDMIGSRLYSTTQYSPKVSAGIVFEF